MLVLKRIILFFLLSINFCRADSIPEKIQQEIIYQNEKASEVTLVWAINNWKTPPKEFWPEGSYQKDKFIYTVMKNVNDTFRLNISVPDRTEINYVFWLSKDKKGEPFDWWDDNFKDNYHVFVTHSKVKSFDLDYSESLKDIPFSFLHSGYLFLVAILVINFLFLYFFKQEYKISISKYGDNFKIAISLSLVVFMFMIRMQINQLFNTNFYFLFGAGFFDLLFVSSFTVVVLWMLSVAKGKFIRTVINSVFYFLILFSAVVSLMNIELIQSLGRPLNYQWFYYSDFLMSQESFNAFKEKLTFRFIINIVSVTTSVFLLAYPIAFLISRFSVNENRRKLILVLSFTIIIFMLVGKIQTKAKMLRETKIINPIVSFVESIYTSSNTPELFTMEIHDSIRAEVHSMHHGNKAKSTLNKRIKHVIVFVMESTPAEYISVYNNKFNVTPNIEKWKSSSRIFESIYVGVPSTNKSLFTLCSGLYPLLSHRAVTSEFPGIKIPFMSSVARDSGFRSAAFSSTSWNYQNMIGFLNNQGFSAIDDFLEIKCEGLVFTSRWSAMDGVDDRCTVDHLVNWISTSPDSSSVSILWTMQTHYPYFFRDEEKNYIDDNFYLNRYLNALNNVDEAFGNLMNKLQNRNLLSESMVILIGDHGEAFGRHDQTTHATKIYEENVHIPCLIFQPELFHGERDNRIGGLIDIAPTVLDVMQVNAPASWQGKSLISGDKKNRAFFFCPYSDLLFGTRNNNWKFIFNANTNSYELFDLSVDPQEATNVASQNPDIVKREFMYVAAWVQMHEKVMKKNLEGLIPRSF